MGWKDIIGHQRVYASFKYAWQRGRMAHAYLLYGEEGIGKQLFAIQLAKSLLCEVEQDEFDSCDQCHSCRQVDARTHPDLFVASTPDDKQEFPVELARSFNGRASLKPVKGSRSIGIILDAENLNLESSNTLLKTLEEPPQSVLLLLITSSLSAILPTIVSRCQLVSFRPLATSDLKQLLDAWEIEESLQAPILSISSGSPGLAKAVVESNLIAQQKVLVALLSKSKVDRYQLSTEMIKVVEEAGKESSSQRKQAIALIRLIGELLRNTIHCQTGPGENQSRSIIGDGYSYQESLCNMVIMLDYCLSAEILTKRRVPIPLILERLADQLSQKGLDQFNDLQVSTRT